MYVGGEGGGGLVYMRPGLAGTLHRAEPSMRDGKPDNVLLSCITSAVSLSSVVCASLDRVPTQK